MIVILYTVYIARFLGDLWCKAGEESIGMRRSVAHKLECLKIKDWKKMLPLAGLRLIVGIAGIVAGGLSRMVRAEGRRIGRRRRRRRRRRQRRRRT
ncbi:hypothetical protein BDZ91DRAFT_714049 [Kalaharituber pfeilii]|nr:hypothetical protein BDZ91DRAFT_714049 [Kalaharituber pfeilii]